MTPRQVTPEEEIADLKAFLDGIKQFPNDDTHRYETDRVGVMAILAAVQAAENDALERAALACSPPDYLEKEDYEDAIVIEALRKAAEEIRALKSAATK